MLLLRATITCDYYVRLLRATITCDYYVRLLRATIACDYYVRLLRATIACDLSMSLTCHPSPSFTTFAFRSSEVRRLLLDLDPYGGTDPLGMLPLFLKRSADIMAPRLSVAFLRLVRLGSFPACWRQANVTTISKGPPSSFVANYLPISIKSVLFKVFERLVSVRLGRFMERSGVLPTTRFGYRRGMGPCDALLCVPFTAECIGEWEGVSNSAD